MNYGRSLLPSPCERVSPRWFLVSWESRFFERNAVLMQKLRNSASDCLHSIRRKSIEANEVSPLTYRGKVSHSSESVNSVSHDECLPIIPIDWQCHHVPFIDFQRGLNVSKKCTRVLKMAQKLTPSSLADSLGCTIKWHQDFHSCMVSADENEVLAILQFLRITIQNYCKLNIRS